MPTRDVEAAIRLLLACCQTEFDPDEVTRAAAAVRDWERVLEQARWHGISSLLYQRLDATCPSAVPASLWRELQTHFALNARRTLILASELRRVIGWLEAEEIPAIAFKGPTLAAILYGDLAMRESGDLDVLVQPQHRQVAIQALIRKGCRAKSGEAALKLPGNVEATLVTPNGIDIDLHWSVTPRYFLTFDSTAAWGRVRRVSCAGAMIPTFAADDLFRALALRGARDCWNSISRVCDMANLMRREAIDWEGLLSPRCTRRLYLVAAQLAHELLSAPLSAEFLQYAASDPAALVLALKLRAQLVSGSAKMTEGLGPCLLHLRLATEAGDRLRYCWRRAFEPNQIDHDSFALPAFLRPALFVARPLRLVAKLLLLSTRAVCSRWTQLG